jgi:hypothetical protein
MAGGDDMECEPGAVVDRENFGFLSQGPTGWGKYQLPVEYRGLSCICRAARGALRLDAWALQSQVFRLAGSAESEREQARA